MWMGGKSTGQGRRCGPPTRLPTLAPLIYRLAHLPPYHSPTRPLPTLPAHPACPALAHAPSRLPPRFELLARLCPNSTGADIRSVCTEAGMYAIRARRKTVTEKDFLDAVNKVRARVRVRRSGVGGGACVHVCVR